MRYALCLQRDIIDEDNIIGFDIATYDKASQFYYNVGEITDEKLGNGCELLADGNIRYDEMGLPKLNAHAPTGLLAKYVRGSRDLLSIDSLYRFRCIVNNITCQGWDVLQGKWLPMPMFQEGTNGVTNNGPYAWCRVKIEPIEQIDNSSHDDGEHRYRLTWAFDTRTNEDLLAEFPLSPFFYSDQEEQQFRLCNVAQQIIPYLGLDGSDFSTFSRYLKSLFNIQENDPIDFAYVAFYIYLVNFLRLYPDAAPTVTLFNKPAETDIPVDMVLDIGNSRTCAVLYEEGQFDKAEPLFLRDMSHPHRLFNSASDRSFDMRFCFRVADIGNDIGLPDTSYFSYASFVRIGKEARQLLYTSQNDEDEGMLQKLTNYSSPKRYLWDEKPYDGVWENLLTKDDQGNNMRDHRYIRTPGLYDLFANDGRYIAGTNEYVDRSEKAHFSRSSLMTFVLIEIFQQALMYINSGDIKNKWIGANMRRYLRTVIVTCPTSMSTREQVRLRQAAHDALDAIGRVIHMNHPIQIVPDIEKLKVTDSHAPVEERTWTYDEATACQLVFLYAETNQRYKGNVELLFEKKGHVRPGCDDKSLTIGTIDIGAGTTDVMVCDYKRSHKGAMRLIPKPLFYDSFTLAGDDILHAIIKNFIIEGKDYGDPQMGSVFSALHSRLQSIPGEELESKSYVKNSSSFSDKVAEINKMLPDNIEGRREKKSRLAYDMLGGFFGTDNSNTDWRTRVKRVDFSMQVLQPMAQFFMELLRQGSPQKVLSFDDFFPEDRPSKNLLDYFESYFGFRFEELSWCFDPNELTRIIQASIEILMKQLSVILHAYHCDIIVLGGRPTSLNAVTDLFIKHIPVTPDRLIRMNDYHIGDWFVTADNRGYIYDQKPLVAVGAMVGYLAINKGVKGMTLDMTELIKGFNSTACYIGKFDPTSTSVTDVYLTPIKTTASFYADSFPWLIGCKQLASLRYQSRPLYALYNNSGCNCIKVTISRNYQDDREELILDEVSDNNGPVDLSTVELLPQSLADKVACWLDTAEFKLGI